MRTLMILAGVFLPACSLLTPAFAQKATGEIHETVFDPTQIVASKVQIEVTDAATGNTKTTLSGADGSYLVPNLLDGTYTITATAPGFQKSFYSRSSGGCGDYRPAHQSPVRRRD
jgi:hypothetical protein